MPQTALTWNELNHGDPLKVKGIRGNFTFRSARIEDDGTVSSVCVIGGISGHSQFRHFTPDRIIKPKKRRGVK
jgi:hypothetical protein